jgi:hypothetical protein
VRFKRFDKEKSGKFEHFSHKYVGMVSSASNVS